MRFAGIDIGSRTIELVVVDEAGQIKASFQADTGFDPITEAKRMVNGATFSRIMATGYGRNLFEIAFDAPTVTEIKAHARGARTFFPDSRAILDIGGQDSKAISLFENGNVKKFEMNDRSLQVPVNFWRLWPEPWDMTSKNLVGKRCVPKMISISPACAPYLPNPK